MIDPDKFEPQMLKYVSEPTPLTLKRIEVIEAKLREIETELSEYREILRFAKQVAELKNILMN
jgi:hypothetical protein